MAEGPEHQGEEADRSDVGRGFGDGGDGPVVARLSQFRNALGLVVFNQRPQNIHEGGKRMTFVLTNLVGSPHPWGDCVRTNKSLAFNLSIGRRATCLRLAPAINHKLSTSFLGSGVAKEIVEDSTNQRYLLGGCFPDESNIHMTVVVSHDIAHAAHLSER